MICSVINTHYLTRRHDLQHFNLQRNVVAIHLLSNPFAHIPPETLVRTTTTCGPSSSKPKLRDLVAVRLGNRSKPPSTLTFLIELERGSAVVLFDGLQVDLSACEKNAQAIWFGVFVNVYHDLIVDDHFFKYSSSKLKRKFQQE